MNRTILLVVGGALIGAAIYLAYGLTIALLAVAGAAVIIAAQRNFTV